MTSRRGIHTDDANHNSNAHVSLHIHIKKHCKYVKCIKKQYRYIKKQYRYIIDCTNLALTTEEWGNTLTKQICI